MLNTQVLGREVVYRLVIDEEEVVSFEGEGNCNGEVNRVYKTPDSVTNSSSVAVDVVGCVTGRKSATDKSSCKTLSRE